MAALTAGAGGIVAFVIAAVVARPVGRRLRSAPAWVRTLAAVLVIAAATAILVFASLGARDLLWGIGVGVGLGGVTGLRYGGPMPWQAEDRSEHTTNGVSIR